MTLWCERKAQGARNSGRVVATTSKGDWVPRSPSARRRSREVGSAQCRSSKARTIRLSTALPSQNPSGHRRQLSSTLNSSGAKLCRRGRVEPGCPRAARAEAHVRLGRGRQARNVSSRSARRCSAGASKASKRCRPHSAIGCSGVFCSSCEAAPFDPGVRGLLQAASGTPPSGETCRDQVRQQLTQAGLHQLRARAPSGAPAEPIPPRGRRTALASSRRLFGRRRWRERCGRAGQAEDTPLSSRTPRPCPRRRRAQRPGAGRSP